MILIIIAYGRVWYNEDLYKLFNIELLFLKFTHLKNSKLNILIIYCLKEKSEK